MLATRSILETRSEFIVITRVMCTHLAFYFGCELVWLSALKSVRKAVWTIGDVPSYRGEERRCVVFGCAARAAAHPHVHPAARQYFVMFQHFLL